MFPYCSFVLLFFLHKLEQEFLREQECIHERSLLVPWALRTTGALMQAELCLWNVHCASGVWYMLVWDFWQKFNAILLALLMWTNYFMSKCLPSTDYRELPSNQAAELWRAGPGVEIQILPHHSGEGGRLDSLFFLVIVALSVNGASPSDSRRWRSSSSA